MYLGYVSGKSEFPTQFSHFSTQNPYCPLLICALIKKQK